MRSIRYDMRASLFALILVGSSVFLSTVKFGPFQAVAFDESARVDRALSDFCRDFENDDYHSATAKSAEEDEKLIQVGFDYDLMLFRKRKWTTILKSKMTIGKVFSIVVL